MSRKLMTAVLTATMALVALAPSFAQGGTAPVQDATSTAVEPASQLVAPKAVGTIPCGAAPWSIPKEIAHQLPSPEENCEKVLVDASYANVEVGEVLYTTPMNADGTCDTSGVVVFGSSSSTEQTGTVVVLRNERCDYFVAAKVDDPFDDLHDLTFPLRHPYNPGSGSDEAKANAKGEGADYHSRSAHTTVHEQDTYQSVTSTWIEWYEDGRYVYPANHRILCTDQPYKGWRTTMCADAQTGDDTRYTNFGQHNVCHEKFTDTCTIHRHYVSGYVNGWSDCSWTLEGWMVYGYTGSCQGR